jgi:hypothetical protein
VLVERRPNGKGARQRGLSYRAGGPQDWSVWARRGRVGHDPTCAEPSDLIVLGVIAARFGSNMAKFRLRWRTSEFSLVQVGGGFGRCVCVWCRTIASATAQPHSLGLDRGIYGPRLNLLLFYFLFSLGRNKSMLRWTNEHVANAMYAAMHGILKRPASLKQKYV